MIKFKNKSVAAIVNAAIIQRNIRNDKVCKSYEDAMGGALTPEQKEQYIFQRFGEPYHIELYDDEKGIEETALGNLDKIFIAIKEEIPNKKEFEDELCLAISHMNLSEAFIYQSTINGDNLRLIQKIIDISKDSLRDLSLSHIDFSFADPDIFAQWTGLKKLSFSNCNISNLQMVSKLPDETVLRFSECEFSDEERVIDEIVKRKGNIGFYDKKFSDIADAIEKFPCESITFNAYCKLRNRYDFSKLADLKIILDDEIDMSREDVMAAIEEMDSLTNATFYVSATSYKKIREKSDIHIPTYLEMSDASEFTIDDLANSHNLRGISLKLYETEIHKYTPEEYGLIRSKIDKIISRIPSDANELEKFAYVYSQLGKIIDYDFVACKSKCNENYNLRKNSANLYGGLVDGKAVCTGYAEILQNTLACIGIKSECIAAGLTEEEKNKILKLNSENPDLSGHAWNRVMIDNNWYLTDLTWDADYIKSGRYSLPYCLKSDADFKGHDIFEYEKNTVSSEYEQPPISEKQKKQAFRKSISNLRKEQGKRGISELFGVARKAIDLGLDNFDLQKVHQKLKDIGRSIFRNKEKDVSKCEK